VPLLLVLLLSVGLQRHWGTAAGDVQPQRHANKLQLVDILGIIVIIIIAGGGG